jgi:hypothetical protein
MLAKHKRRYYIYLNNKQLQTQKNLSANFSAKMDSFSRLINSKKAQFVAIGFDEKKYGAYCKEHGNSIENIIEGIDKKELNGMYFLCPLADKIDGISINSLVLRICEFIPDLWYKTDFVQLNKRFNQINDEKD